MNPIVKDFWMRRGRYGKSGMRAALKRQEEGHGGTELWWPVPHSTLQERAELPEGMREMVNDD